VIEARKISKGLEQSPQRGRVSKTPGSCRSSSAATCRRTDPVVRALQAGRLGTGHPLWQGALCGVPASRSIEQGSDRSSVFISAARDVGSADAGHSLCESRIPRSALTPMRKSVCERASVPRTPPSSPTVKGLSCANAQLLGGGAIGRNRRRVKCQFGRSFQKILLPGWYVSATLPG
jgi:hypothetical protein